jgi:hypothetical protein
MRSAERLTMTFSGRLIALALLATATAVAQAPPVRVRGTVQQFDGKMLAVATESGIVQIGVSPDTAINGLEAKTADDIRTNAFIGATATRNAVGRWQATEIHIFPESMRGAGEGHYAWDLPESTMTNGAVMGTVGGGSGRTLHVKYADGELDIEVSARTKVVALTAGDASLLVRGATVFVLAAPQDGGRANAVAIVAETRGVKPPM